MSFNRPSLVHAEVICTTHVSHRWHRQLLWQVATSERLQIVGCGASCQHITMMPPRIQSIPGIHSLAGDPCPGALVPTNWEAQKHPMESTYRGGYITRQSPSETRYFFASDKSYPLFGAHPLFDRSKAAKNFKMSNVIMTPAIPLLIRRLLWYGQLFRPRLILSARYDEIRDEVGEVDVLQ